MSDQTISPVSDHHPQNASALCRLYWMIFGNLALFVLLVLIVEKRVPFFTGIDVACVAVLASLILVRYVDIRYLGGGTSSSDSEPATLRHWRRYAATLTGLATVAWIVAHTAAQMLR